MKSFNVHNVTVIMVTPQSTDPTIAKITAEAILWITNSTMNSAPNKIVTPIALSVWNPS